MSTDGDYCDALRAIAHWMAAEIERRAEVLIERNARIATLEGRLRVVQAVVDAQAEDEGLWFMARTAPEAYLQQELRELPTSGRRIHHGRL